MCPSLTDGVAFTVAVTHNTMAIATGLPRANRLRLGAPFSRKWLGREKDTVSGDSSLHTATATYPRRPELFFWIAHYPNG